MYAAIVNLRTEQRVKSILVSEVYEVYNSMQNSTAIKCMCKRLKPGPFSSSSSSGLGTRVTDDNLVKVFQQTFFL